MKRLLCGILAAALFVPALAEDFDSSDYEEYEDTYEDYAEYEEEIIEVGDAQPLKLKEVYSLDLDGDGAEESVCARMNQFGEEEERLGVQVEAEGQTFDFDSDVIFGGAAYAADLDGDGGMELLLTGDEASADYFTWCLKFSREEGLQPLQFADANRGENTGEYEDFGYGRITAVNGNAMTLVGSQDALGTWMCARQFALRDGRFEFDDDGVWQVVDDLSDPENWEYRALVAVKEIPVELESGESSTLPVGARLLITDTDKQSFVGFQTEDGQRGKILVAPDTEEGWGFLIDGENEYNFFEYIPYAD